MILLDSLHGFLRQIKPRHVPPISLSFTVEFKQLRRSYNLTARGSVISLHLDASQWHSSWNTHQTVLQVLVEPHNSLAEGLLLGELVVLVAQVRAHREAVRHAAEQVDLPRLAGLDQGALGLVAELGGEDLVDLWWLSAPLCYSTIPDQLTSSSNRQRTGYGAQFLVRDERRVRGVAGIELSVLQEAADILYQPVSNYVQTTRQHGNPTFPPKQYPTPPIFFTPRSCRRYLTVDSTTGSTLAGWWFPIQAGRSALPASMSPSLMGSPWNRSGTTVR